MRKADYAALAKIIKKERDKRRAKCMPPGGPVWHDENMSVLTALDKLASDFADVASVDKPEFLAACGIVGGTQPR